MSKLKTYGPYLPKAFVAQWVHMPEIKCILSATTASKARYQVYLTLQDCSYTSSITEIKVWRDKEFDGLAIKATKDGQYFNKIKGIELPEKYYPDLY